MFNKTIITM